MDGSEVDGGWLAAEADEESFLGMAMGLRGGRVRVVGWKIGVHHPLIKYIYTYTFRSAERII